MRLLLLLYPWLELWSLIQLGVETNALVPLLWVFAGFVVGGALLRRVGMSGVQQLRAAQQGRVLHQQLLVDDMATALAALLLIVPGLLSDVLALIVLLGPLRRTLVRWLSLRTPDGYTSPQQPHGPQQREGPPRSERHINVTLEGEYRRLDDDDRSV
jgi:UPF0716 protein FxsA